jgi:hypothetical protein
MAITREVNITVEVLEASDFFLTADPVSLSVRKPAPIIFTITSHPLNMYVHDIQLEVTGAVLGPAAQFSANPIGAGGSSVITIPTENFQFSQQPFQINVKGTEIV